MSVWDQGEIGKLELAQGDQPGGDDTSISISDI